MTLFISGILVGAGLSATAASVTSGWSSFASYNGKTYSWLAWVENSPKRAGATVQLNSGSVPAGWMGVTPASYKGSALCAKGPAKYSTVASGAFSSNVSGASCGSGNYKSVSAVHAWMGSYYKTNTPASPFQAW